jgi:hypothetical protein
MERHCSSCGLPSFIPENQEMCQDCRAFLDPTIRFYRKTRIATILEDNNISVADFMIDCDNVNIIIQVDEHQNQIYHCECDVAYMIDLHQNFHPTPVIFIRYNPDNYVDNLGLKHAGAHQNLEREDRLVNLIQNIRNGIVVPVGLSIYYLYYDGDDGNNNSVPIDYMNTPIGEIVNGIESTRVYEATYE